MRVVVPLLSYPPRRFIGSELMTHSLLKRLQARGHEVVVVGKENKDGWSWDGIPVVPRPIPAADVLIYHAEFWEDIEGASWVSDWHGPKVAICHNSRMGVQIGLYNCRPDFATVNSETAMGELQFAKKIVVHPPVPEQSQVNGDRVAVINMEKTSKIGPFWDLVRAMPDVDFLGVKGGYGTQAIPPGRRPKNVKILDQVPPDRMDEVWSQVRVLLVPSATESWSMVASEAMAHGIPVIANVTPGLLENLNGVGLWANRDVPGEWVYQLRFLLGAWDDYSAAVRARAELQRERHEAEAEAWCDAVERLGNG